MRTGYTNDGGSGGRALEPHYLVGEISVLWGYSPKTIRRIFENELGVIFVGHEETCHKRGYQTISIPASVLARVHSRLEQRKNDIGGRGL